MMTVVSGTKQAWRYFRRIAEDIQEGLQAISRRTEMGSRESSAAATWPSITSKKKAAAVGC